MQPIASIRHSAPLHRPRFHPTLPLLATADAHHIASHIWTWKNGELQRIGSVGYPGTKRTATVWEDALSDNKSPDVAWHPTHPLFAATGGEGVQLWRCEPEGTLRLARVTGSPLPSRQIEEQKVWQMAFESSHASGTSPRVSSLPLYWFVGFSPSGKSLWASMSEADDTEEGDPWRSDWIGLEEHGPSEQLWRWDTDLALHPEGELMAAFESNQGATLLKFARVVAGPDGEHPQTMQRALVLDVDGYCDLTFSPCGDMFLYHGNAYENFCVVHAFPSLRRLGVVPLGAWKECTEKLPPSWHEYRWSFFQNVVFSPDNVGLLLGLDSGHLVEVALNSWQPRMLGRLFDRPISSLRVRPHDGLLAVTDFEGLLQLYQLPHIPRRADQNGRPLTKQFLASTKPTTRLARWDDLALTNGEREWNDEALNADELPEDAPTWAQMEATFRKLLAQEQGGATAPPKPTSPGDKQGA